MEAEPASEPDQRGAERSGAQSSCGRVGRRRCLRSLSQGTSVTVPSPA
jgi:hypothetical protein